MSMLPPDSRHRRPECEETSEDTAPRGLDLPALGAVEGDPGWEVGRPAGGDLVVHLEVELQPVDAVAVAEGLVLVPVTGGQADGPVGDGEGVAVPVDDR